MMGRNWRIAAAAVLLGTAATAARAADLRMGVSAFPLSVDPHFYNGIGDRNLSLHLFSRLVEQKGDMSLAPGLAAEWKLVNDTVWEFTLREGVTWSDGKPLTPEDVVFSLTRSANIPNSPLGYAPFTRDIASVEVAGPRTVRIVTKQPSPILPVNMSALSIVAKHAAEGKDSGEFDNAAVSTGTGPFRLVSFARNDRAVLERNPAFWGEKPEWDRVEMRFIANEGARSAALLAGDVDLIDAPSRNDLPRLRQDERFRVVSTPGNRSIMLLPNVIAEGGSPEATDNDGKPLAQNPLRDLRVRQALSLGIDRKGLAERVLEGTAQAAGQFMWPGAYSFTPDIQTPPFDQARAKALLAEAGFPAGFRLTLSAFADRPDFRTVAQAIAQMWTRMGVRTEVNAVPAAVYLGRGAKHEYLMPFFSWGISTGEAGYVLNNIFTTMDSQTGAGPANWGGYSNPALDALIARAQSTMDDAAREALLVQGQKAVADDVAAIQLYQLVNFWATRRGVAYGARQDQRTVATSAHSVR
ncbi:ABC transporter substrate-binding protein [Roseomonas haemaphysalidis]|nr:ABC transporter substrate-binding protein [Roseomonas haemaphysalidis]